jgi:tryptophanyl-tRNA synthetase
MSKSYGNAIFLSDSPDEILSKVATMITDPQRARRSDPGNPDICNVFDFHKLYTPADTVRQIETQCRTAAIGCVECKREMARSLAQALAPIREKRAYYEQRPGIVEEIIAEGNNRARKTAQQTMERVREAMQL